ncbi:LysR family transcriptional regulator [Streptomyces sp. NPDC102365]|uniref:LysR family transcriptional regulator n=1 Tax=Streptomyces sp. NPDC102365 TaxID=3366162 RepID=UPI0037F7110F
MSDVRCDPTVRQLEVFLMLASELHFGRAAARLYLSQPALSRQIRALETRLGVDLLDRTTRSVHLTSAGSVLLPKVRSVVEAARDMREEARSQTRGAFCGPRVGFFQAEAALPHVAGVLQEVRRIEPGVDIRLATLDFRTQASAVLDGTVDVAFCYLPVARGIQFRSLHTEPRTVGVHSAHPLAGRDEVRLEDLAAEKVIGMSEAVPPLWRDFWTLADRPRDSVPLADHSAEDFETVFTAVALGHGVCVAPSAARRLYPRPGVSYLDVAGISDCTSVLAWAAERRDTPEVALFRKAAETLLRRRDHTSHPRMMSVVGAPPHG